MERQLSPRVTNRVMLSKWVRTPPGGAPLRNTSSAQQSAFIHEHTGHEDMLSCVPAAQQFNGAGILILCTQDKQIVYLIENTNASWPFSRLTRRELEGGQVE